MLTLGKRLWHSIEPIVGDVEKPVGRRLSSIPADGRRAERTLPLCRHLLRSTQVFSSFLADDCLTSDISEFRRPRRRKARDWSRWRGKDFSRTASFGSAQSPLLTSTTHWMRSSGEELEFLTVIGCCFLDKCLSGYTMLRRTIAWWAKCRARRQVFARSSSPWGRTR